MKWAVSLCIIALLVAPNIGMGAVPTAMPMFVTEQQAQQHCPDDTVVWLNTRTGVYHLKGTRWYGATKEGAYVCLKETQGRPALNGQ
jgi:hypothetical protein